MKKLSFLKCFVETLPVASESLVKTLRATSLLGMMVLAPIGASAQVTIGSGALPQATLDIVGNPSETGKAFRLDDGNQADGKVLTATGDNGIGTWKPIALTMITGTVNTGATVNMADLPAGIPLAAYKVVPDIYIDLPQGKWAVFYYIPITFNFGTTTPDQISMTWGFAPVDNSNSGTAAGHQYIYGPFNVGTTFRQLFMAIVNNDKEGITRYTFRVGSCAISPSTTLTGKTFTVLLNGLNGTVYAMAVSD